jgi:hypothetical protein
MRSPYLFLVSLVRIRARTKLHIPNPNSNFFWAQNHQKRTIIGWDTSFLLLPSRDGTKSPMSEWGKTKAGTDGIAEGLKIPWLKSEENERIMMKRCFLRRENNMQSIQECLRANDRSSVPARERLNFEIPRCLQRSLSTPDCWKKHQVSAQWC